MIEIRNISKIYQMGDNKVRALNEVSLTIEEGEFVAIMGPSGSGKSTLMQVLGLLDVPTSGSYKLYEKETASMTEDQLAVLRREAIGFVFQQFNLLPRMTAAENVALPLLYSKRNLDLGLAAEFLNKVGLGKRLEHKTNELSGGQQQRVAIARSLVNFPRMILADEPTGNLDSTSEQEIMAILKSLNQQGITVILVTHEEEIGRQANRLIRMRDGVVQSDERVNDSASVSRRGAETGRSRSISPELPEKDLVGLSEIIEHFRQGFRSLAANKVRTALSMLGILIGVAAVVAMLALGKGAQNAIEAQLASLGSNRLVLRPGAFRTGGVSLDAGSVTRLTTEDSQVILQNFPEVRRVAAELDGKGQVTFADKNWSTQVRATNADYAPMVAAVPVVGRFFTDDEDRRRERVAVLGMTVVRQLFAESNPIGEYIKINKVPFQVVGVLPEKGFNGWRDQDDIIAVPLLTGMHRLFGKDYVDEINLEVIDPSQIDFVIERVKEVMTRRHRVPPSQTEPFQVRNMADIQAALSESNRTMSLLLASIAGISLLVGGIGIMNIMLVSVTERTREIGLRKAVGARRRDILAQFMVEAVAVTSVGGVSGIILGWLATELMSRLAGWSTSVSGASILLSFFFSASVGLIFGIYPAKKASLLSPIQALRYD